MSDTDQQRITAILQDPQVGNDLPEQLLPLVYNELRRLARAKMAQAPPGQTLQPTALVHEAYMKLFGNVEVRWESRGHFFGAAANAMRQILVNRAKRKQTEKHGGKLQRTDFNEDLLAVEPPAEKLLAIDESLQNLEKMDARLGKVVMLRYFAGLTISDIAKALDMSATTVKRDWEFARTWLQREMSK